MTGWGFCDIPLDGCDHSVSGRVDVNEIKYRLLQCLCKLGYLLDKISCIYIRCTFIQDIFSSTHLHSTAINIHSYWQSPSFLQDKQCNTFMWDVFTKNCNWATKHNLRTYLKHFINKNTPKYESVLSHNSYDAIRPKVEQKTENIECQP